ncbi:hypothetical protein OESDEN_18641 [Oesophagostomum dentatum]|uniref:Uncharacterized protein n=1 Tax=Oesophagostomum dentatum TaxID=61180 RepID=A0A0B1SCS8_OESDE|nr:hypothetical protein OESDEN_18641 [Oesophagostomum dentatum]
MAIDSESDSYAKSEFLEMSVKNQPARGIRETTNFIKTSAVQVV